MKLPGEKFRRGEVGAFGHRLTYAEAGSGDVILSLPGSAGMEMSLAKDMLAERFRVIELNPPGWGEDPGLAAVMKQKHLALILAEAAAELGVDRYHLIGTSMGGTNALWLAAQHPERVRSIVLEAPMALLGPGDLVDPGFPELLRMIREGLVNYDEAANPAPPPLPRKPWSTAEFWHEIMRRRFKMFATILNPDEDQLLAPFARDTKIPTTFLLGTKDDLLNPCFAEHFQAKMPLARVVLLDGLTHDIQNEAPEIFVEHVIATIEGS